MKIVKYRVTGGFGNKEEGAIIDAVLLAEEPKITALLYHPRSPGSCASIEMCKNVGPYYVSQDEGASDLFGWINLEKQADIDKLVENLRAISYKNTTRKYLLKQKKAA